MSRLRWNEMFGEGEKEKTKKEEAWLIQINSFCISNETKNISSKIP